MEPLHLNYDERMAIAKCVINWIGTHPEDVFLDRAAPLRTGYAKLKTSITAMQDKQSSNEEGPV
jgi:hypothetical protein